jgi:hypothetical protein
MEVDLKLGTRLQEWLREWAGLEAAHPAAVAAAVAQPVGEADIPWNIQEKKLHCEYPEHVQRETQSSCFVARN